MPINDKMAIRLVGYTGESAGWINNVAGSRTYPGVEDPATCAASGVPCSADDITNTNEDMIANNYNTVERTGGRVALRIDLNENWTISPSLWRSKSTPRDTAERILVVC